MELLKKSWAWLKWPVALGVVAWLYLRNRESLEQIAHTPKAWHYLFAALLLVGGSAVLTFFRWFLLVRAQQFEFPFRDALRLGFIGLISNYVAPGAVGGDIVKAILMARDQKSRRAAAIATVILDRILGMLALVMVGAIASLLPAVALDQPELRTVRLLMWVGTGAGLVGLVLMLTPAFTHARWIRKLESLPKIGKLLGELIHSVELYQSRPMAVVLALLISLVGHAGLISGFFLCALWMKQPWTPDLSTHFFFMPTAELFGAFVPVPAGMGALEGVVSQFYKDVRPESISAESAAAAGLIATLAFRVVSLGVAAIGGAYYLTARREIVDALHEAEVQNPTPLADASETP